MNKLSLCECLDVVLPVLQHVQSPLSNREALDLAIMTGFASVGPAAGGGALWLALLDKAIAGTTFHLRTDRLVKICELSHARTVS